MSGDVPDMRQQRLAEASPVELGDVVAGKYRVEELLALGGMGVVALAEHEVLGQHVAIKFLLESERSEESVQRFLREARAAAGIDSEHVVRVHDCGKLPSGVPYMVMEHLEGIELSKEMRRQGRFPIEEAVDLVLGALLGIAEAHAKGVVHRDIKPSNLFLVQRPGRDRLVKVLDFGISKIQPGPDAPVDDDDLTQTSMVLGSPRYISPEQARSSKGVDERTDIWSVGVVLYQLLSGEPPFGGNTFGEILTNILLTKPEPLPSLRDEIPPALAAVVATCLTRDREDRYANVSELANALAPFGGLHANEQAAKIDGILGNPAPSRTDLRDPNTDVGGDESVTAITVASDESPTQGTWAQTQGGDARRAMSTRLLVGAALALALGAFGGYRLLSSSSTGTSSTGTSSTGTSSPGMGATGSTAPGAVASSAAPTTSTTAEPTLDATSEPAVEPSATASATASANATATATAPPASQPPPPVVARPAPPPPPPPPPGGVLDRSD